MAREYARTRISIADDEDLEELTADAQWLYFRVLIPDPTLSMVGVADWRPKRLLRKAADMTMPRLMAAAAHLEDRRYALFDLDTEEVLVRSYVRSDEILRNPKAAVGAVRAFRAVASKTLRAGVVTEVLRARDEHPEYSSWKSPISQTELAELLTRRPLAEVGYTNQLTNHIGIPITNQITNPITNAEPVENANPSEPGYQSEWEPDHQPDHQPHSLKPLALSPKPVNQNPETGGGYVSPEGHQGPTDGPPTPHCPQHPEGTDQPCRACGDARRARQAWETDQTRHAAEAARAEREQRTALTRREIDACNLCDTDGYRGVQVCDHNPDQAEINRRGAERVRAQLAKSQEPECETPTSNNSPTENSPSPSPANTAAPTSANPAPKPTAPAPTPSKTCPPTSDASPEPNATNASSTTADKP